MYVWYGIALARPPRLPAGRGEAYAPSSIRGNGRAGRAPREEPSRGRARAGRAPYKKQGAPLHTDLPPTRRTADCARAARRAAPLYAPRVTRRSRSVSVTIETGAPLASTTYTRWRPRVTSVAMTSSSVDVLETVTTGLAAKTAA